MSRAERMQELITRWESSGLSQRAFAKQEGISYSRLLYWRRRLASRRRESARTGDEPVRLDPVRIVPDPARVATAFELRTARGLSIAVPTGFDEDELRRLLEVVTGC